MEKLVGMMASFDMRLVEYESRPSRERRSEWTGLGNRQPYANAGGWLVLRMAESSLPRPVSHQDQSRPDLARWSPGEAFVRPP